jgi:signal peptidase I
MRELLKLIAFFVLIAVLLLGVARAFFVGVVQTDNYSMVPTLLAGDTFLVFTKAKLALGDIAVCQDPTNSGQLVVGRVMAREGETLSIEDDIVQWNNWKVESVPVSPLEYLDRTSGEELKRRMTTSLERFGGRTFSVAHVSRGRRRNLKNTPVQEGLFLLGDNRNLARDSRDFGTVETQKCIGRAFFILDPARDNGDFFHEQRRFTWIE